jgi:phosphopantothenoylcysteine decarboxylase/phosphopantothenate--cysteine ligase
VTTRPPATGASGVDVVPVETAAEMEAAMADAAPGARVVVMAAAVADFRPKSPSDRKISKGDGVPEIVLEPTPDILAGLAAARRPDQVLVGFAAETHDVLDRARSKLVAKGIDMIVANDVAAPGVGFDHDTNAVVIVERDGPVTEVPLTTKAAVADAVLDRVVARLGSIDPNERTVT